MAMRQPSDSVSQANCVAAMVAKWTVSLLVASSGGRSNRMVARSFLPFMAMHTILVSGQYPTI